MSHQLSSGVNSDSITIVIHIPWQFSAINLVLETDMEPNREGIETLSAFRSQRKESTRTVLVAKSSFMTTLRNGQKTFSDTSPVNTKVR